MLETKTDRFHYINMKESLEMVPSIEKTCLPLLSLNIKNILYMRLDFNLHELSLLSNKTYLLMYLYANPICQLFAKLVSNVVKTHAASDNFKICDIWPPEGKEELFQKLYEINFAHIFSISRYDNCHFESICFGSGKHNKEIVNTYLNNSDVLREFTFDFVAQFKNNEEEKCTFIPTNQVSSLECITSSYGKISLLIGTGSNKKILLLTKREMELLILMNQNMSAKKISKNSGMSLRSVECHIWNIKGKFDVYSKKELLELYSSGKIMVPHPT